MKKLTVFLLIVLCFVFAFVSCDDKGGTKSPSSTEKPLVENPSNPEASEALKAAPEVKDARVVKSTAKTTEQFRSYMKDDETTEDEVEQSFYNRLLTPVLDKIYKNTDYEKYYGFTTFNDEEFSDEVDKGMTISLGKYWGWGETKAEKKANGVRQEVWIHLIGSLSDELVVDIQAYLLHPETQDTTGYSIFEIQVDGKKIDME